MSASLSMGGKILQGLSALFGIAMFAIGVLWLVAPGDAAAALGATLLEGTGLATQIGDSTSFFLGSGFLMAYGAIARKPTLLTTGGVLIGMVAPARLIAWQFHGAALTLDAIIPEIVMLVVTLSAARAMRAAG